MSRIGEPHEELRSDSFVENDAQATRGFFPFSPAPPPPAAESSNQGPDIISIIKARSLRYREERERERKRGGVGEVQGISVNAHPVLNAGSNREEQNNEPQALPTRSAERERERVSHDEGTYGQ